MNPTPKRQRPYDPSPKPGLRSEHFRKICRNGLGDGNNSYAHSMAWFRGKLHLGTTRSNLCMLKLQSAFTDTEFSTWPIECPSTLDELYQTDRRAQIWRYDPTQEQWQQSLRAPMVEGLGGQLVTREIGYRAMAVFQGESDPEPAIYASSWAPGRAPGGLLVRSSDGEHYAPVSDYGILKNTPIQTTRLLIPFKGRLFFSPTARRGTNGGQQNTAGLPVIFESSDPRHGGWTEASTPGFGDPNNLGVFAMHVLDDQLYAGTFNLDGFQVWRSDCSGTPPYRWTRVIDQGAYRGPENQIVASMQAFNGALYVGSAIQGGGRDRINDVGPDASELLRIHPDDSWDLIVGKRRNTPQGHKTPLSGFPAGFGNFFNGYFWCMTSHDGWLYLGTYDWSVTLQWVRMDKVPNQVRKLIRSIGVERIVQRQGGCELWRSRDGENWLPVDRQGLGNPYNWGIRNLVSTPHGLFVGTANVFAPKVAKRKGGEWVYEENPAGGLEVWLGAC